MFLLCFWQYLILFFNFYTKNYSIEQYVCKGKRIAANSVALLIKICYAYAMSYKYELHCHTAAVSRCGRVVPEEIVKLYMEKGYNGIVVTDHYSPMTFPIQHVACPQKEVDFYLSGYRRMKAAAPADFTVLLGMELRHYGTANDYLLYGVEEDFLYQAGNLLKVLEKDVKRLCEEKGYLVYEAHPFRPGRTRVNPKYIDGVEVYNGKTKDAENHKALLWAQKHGKLMVSGSDFHRRTELAKGGIITEKRIQNNQDLLTILKKSKFRLINVDL